MPSQIADILLDLGANAFLEPYLRRSLGDEPDPDAASAPVPQPRAAVRVLQPGEDAADHALEAEAHRLGVPAVTLRCAHIVGTGMTGLPRRMAEKIYSGWYVHTSGADTRVNLIHAADVAEAVAAVTTAEGLAALSCHSCHALTLTDSREHTIRELAEALSFRLGDKRIFTVKPWLAKLLLGRALYAAVTADQTLAADGPRMAELFPRFQAHDVCQYLRTHTYDDASL